MHEDKKKIRVPYLEAINGLKVIAMLLIFYWHSRLPEPKIDLGARACEFLFIVSGFLSAYNMWDNEDGTLNDCFRKVINTQAKFFELNFITMIWALLILDPMYSIKDTILYALTNSINIQGWFLHPTFNGATWFLCPLIASYFLVPLFKKFINNFNAFKQFLLIYSFRIFLEIYNDSLFNVSMHSYPVIRIIEFYLGMLLCQMFFVFKEKIHNNNTIFYTIIEMVSICVSVLGAYYYEGKWIRGYFLIFSFLLIFVFAFEKGVISKFLKNNVFKKFGKIQMYFFIFHYILIQSWYFIMDKYSLVIPVVISTLIIFVICLILSEVYERYYSRNAIKRYRRLIEYIERFLK